MRQAFDRRSVLSFAVGAALLTSVTPSRAETLKFKADLTGPGEVPPNQTAGHGTINVTYDPGTKQLSWDGSFAGLTGPATMAHFHGPAEPGKNAGVVIWISEKGQPFSSPFKGSATLTEDQATQLLAGQWYVNIHTAANPGGEIRGQLARA
jgi:hypothetical protein